MHRAFLALCLKHPDLEAFNLDHSAVWICAYSAMGVDPGWKWMMLEKIDWPNVSPFQLWAESAEEAEAKTGASQCTFYQAEEKDRQMCLQRCVEGLCSKCEYSLANPDGDWEALTDDFGKLNRRLHHRGGSWVIQPFPAHGPHPHLTPGGPGPPARGESWMGRAGPV